MQSCMLQSSSLKIAITFTAEKCIYKSFYGKLVWWLVFCSSYYLSSNKPSFQSYRQTFPNTPPCHSGLLHQTQPHLSTCHYFLRDMFNLINAQKLCTHIPYVDNVWVDCLPKDPCFVLIKNIFRVACFFTSSHRRILCCLAHFLKLILKISALLKGSTPAMCFQVLPERPLLFPQ